MTTEYNLPPTALANLRHLYAQLLYKGEREAAEGLLSPAIKQLEHWQADRAERYPNDAELRTRWVAAGGSFDGADEREKHQENNLMAECMDMVRDDLIRAGIISEEVPPMMLPEAIKRALKERVEAEREKCALVCDRRVMGDNNREDSEARRCADAIRAGAKEPSDAT